jgi:DNA-binding CsgD family transcriptional regulator
MYKYLSITTNTQEMMVMLKSLPVSTIVFDSNAKIVDINQPALEFLKIKSIEDYGIKRWEALNDRNYIHLIIQKLKSGKIVRDKNFLLKCPDRKIISINYSACVLSGVKPVFIFQFFVVSKSIFSPLEHLNYTVHHANKNLNIICKGNSDIKQVFADHEVKQPIFKRYLNEEVIQTVSRKYPSLSSCEVVICGLIVLNMSTAEIAIVTEKKVASVYTAIYRLFKKLGVNSRRKLYLKLIDEYSKDIV